MSNISFEEKRKKTLEFFNKANIVLTSGEKTNIELADMGLGRDDIGLQLITYVSTERCSAKELVLFAGQTCPEHRHPPINEQNCGKEETFRCRFGEVYLYVEGPHTNNIRAKLPKDKEKTFTVFNEIVLNPGEQYTLAANTLHWFQAGASGCVVSEFSTRNLDEYDIFTDAEIIR